MFDIVKLKLEHLTELSTEPENSHLLEWFKTDHAKLLVESEETVAGIVKGELMIAAGLTPYWTGRAHLWCTFSEKAKGNFVTVFRGIEKYLHSRSYRRIEMDVPLNTKYTHVAHKRAMLLGFQMECPCAKYYRPSGGDSALYSWTKGARNVG